MPPSVHPSIQHHACPHVLARTQRRQPWVLDVDGAVQVSKRGALTGGYYENGAGRLDHMRVSMGCGATMWGVDHMVAVVDI
eukprot:366510-Chlamydomonas_euryale.AAC.21